MTTRARKFNIVVPQGATGIQGIQGVKGNDGTSVNIKGEVALESDLSTIISPDPGDGYIVTATGHL
jgi:hypothetical protein